MNRQFPEITGEKIQRHFPYSDRVAPHDSQSNLALTPLLYAYHTGMNWYIKSRVTIMQNLKDLA